MNRFKNAVEPELAQPSRFKIAQISEQELDAIFFNKALNDAFSTGKEQTYNKVDGAWYADNQLASERIMTKEEFDYTYNAVPPEYAEEPTKPVFRMDGFLWLISITCIVAIAFLLPFIRLVLK